MKYILKELKQYKKEAILAPLFKMLEAFFDLFVPLVVANMINVGIAKGDMNYIYKQIGLLVLLAIIGVTCSIAAQYFAAKAAVKSASNLRLKLFEHIQSLSFSELDHIGTSTLITRITSDINQIQNGVNMSLRLLLRSPFIVLGAMVMAFIINPNITTIFLVMIIVLSIVIFVTMKFTNPGYKLIQKRLDTITGKTRENLTGVRVVRAFGKEEDEKEAFYKSNDLLNKAQRKIGQISALMNPLTYVIINLAIVGVLYFGSIYIDKGLMLNGDIVALINYINQILVELVKLASTIVLISKTIASCNRVEEILETKSSMTYGDVKQVTDSEVIYSFKNAGLAYKGSQQESVSDLNFDIIKGQTIGIIGGTGSGKSTVAHLMSRFYDATSGEVYFNGVNIKDYSQDYLTHNIHVVMQKAQLFKGTIRSNLLWGKQDATDEELYKALEIAQAIEVVENKPLKLDEPVEQGGRNFSGGQRQRLCIARALVSDAKVLILDDSASALDYTTDAKLRVALKNLDSSLTTIIISQRTSSIAHADLILVLDDGVIVGKGTHDELLETCDEYKEIYESQFKKGDVYGNK